MEWGQQFTNHEELVNNATYHNIGYIDIRNKMYENLITDLDKMNLRSRKFCKLLQTKLRYIIENKQILL